MAKVDVATWKARQEELRARMRIEPLKKLPRFIAGVDCAFTRDKKFVLSVAVVWDRETDAAVEYSEAILPSTVPYVPGYLSFREGPTVAAAITGLSHPFEVMLFDGQGYAHPRRCGLGTHVAVELGLRSAGVAKSRLIGTFDEPAFDRGSSSPLMDGDERIGTVLRTRDGVRPLFISIGNRIDLPSAQKLVLACCRRYRLPEPTRLADKAVAALKASSA